jgi:hypothetical protein
MASARLSTSRPVERRVKTVKTWIVEHVVEVVAVAILAAWCVVVTVS